MIAIGGRTTDPYRLIGKKIIGNWKKMKLFCPATGQFGKPEPSTFFFNKKQFIWFLFCLNSLYFFVGRVRERWRRSSRKVSRLSLSGNIRSIITHKVLFFPRRPPSEEEGKKSWKFPRRPHFPILFSLQKEVGWKGIMRLSFMLPLTHQKSTKICGGCPTQPQTVVCKLNRSSVGIYKRCIHVFARLAPICKLSRCLLTKFLHRSSVRSLLRVRCWLGTRCSEERVKHFLVLLLDAFMGMFIQLFFLNSA